MEDAIGELKLRIKKSPSTHAREIYELLSLRYLQQFSQKEVADQLSISVSHMNRIQQKALEDLAAYLWIKYTLQEKKPAGDALDESASSSPKIARLPVIGLQRSRYGLDRGSIER